MEQTGQYNKLIQQFNGLKQLYLHNSLNLF